MKKLFSVLLSLFVLLQSFGVHATDLLSIGAVIEHAQFHEAEFGDDLFTFYQKHFGTSSEEHVDHQHQDKHEKLPQHDNLCSTVAHVFIVNPTNTITVEASNLNELSLNFFYLEGNSYTLAYDFFQPPIFA